MAVPRIADPRPGDRRGEHHAAVAPRLHRRKAGLGRQEGAAQIDPQHLVPLRDRDILDQRPGVDAGVLHQYVDAAEALQGGGDDAFGIGLAGDVGGDEDGRPDRRQPLGGRGTGLGLAVGDHHRCAFLDEAFGDAGANAARRADHDRHAIRQSSAHHVPPRLLSFPVRDSAAGSPVSGYPAAPPPAPARRE